MSDVLVVVAHPDLSRSIINRRLIEAIDGLEGIRIHDLYSLYSDFNIAVSDEQRLLEQAQTIVLQHPIYWYSCPALLKEWLDKVFVRNFAYGRQGKALQGKCLLSVVSAGGPEHTYCETGSNCYVLKDFLQPFEMTAKFCQMTYAEPLVLHNTYRADEQDIIEHVEKYKKLIVSLCAN